MFEVEKKKKKIAGILPSFIELLFNWFILWFLFNNPKPNIWITAKIFMSSRGNRFLKHIICGFIFMSGMVSNGIMNPYQRRYWIFKRPETYWAYSCFRYVSNMYQKFNYFCFSLSNFFLMKSTGNSDYINFSNEI